MKKHIFAVAGGDMRFAFLASSLAAEGYKTLALGFGEDSPLSEKVVRIASVEPLSGADTVVLPLPCSADGILLRAPCAEKSITLAECVDAMKSGSTLLGGMLPYQLFEKAAARGVEAVDYFAREELAVKNAVPTAEGALAIAINEMPTTVAGMRVLVTGYGRVARVLTRMLMALNAEVTVAARSCSDRAWAETDGARAIHTRRLAPAAPCFDMCYNTVPALIFDRETLTALRRDCLLVDLASKPGGVDMEAAKELGVQVIWALSLPGKVAPETAAGIIKETILNILYEKGGMSDGC